MSPNNETEMLFAVLREAKNNSRLNKPKNLFLILEEWLRN